MEGDKAMTEDITFCNEDCGYLRCLRNKKHIKSAVPRSFADLSKTRYCYKNYATGRVISLTGKEEIRG